MSWLVIEINLITVWFFGWCRCRLSGWILGVDLVLWKLANAKLKSVRFEVLANPLPSSDLLLIGRSIGKDLNHFELQVKALAEWSLSSWLTPSLLVIYFLLGDQLI